MTVQEQAEALRVKVAQHNAAIRQHRKQRRDAQDRLTELEAECRRRGIAITLVPQHSEGAVHGRPKTPA